MRYGVIDIGSNTIRLNIYKVEKGKAALLLSRKNMAGLASFIKKQEMNQKGIDRAVEALVEFRDLLRQLGIDKVHAFATAALRNIKNSEAAVAQISQRSGFSIQVLSGEKEAELDFIGATQSMQMHEGILIDIGGASTELVMYMDGKILQMCSLPVGSLNMYNAFVAHILPTKKERKEIQNRVLAELEKETAFAGKIYEEICGVGGSIRAAGRLNNALFDLPFSQGEIDASHVKKMIRQLENDEEDAWISTKTLDILLQIVPERVRTVLPGMIILQTLIRFFQAKKIRVSTTGIREGYLQSFVLPGCAEKKTDKKVPDPYRDGEKNKQHKDKIVSEDADRVTL